MVSDVSRPALPTRKYKSKDLWIIRMLWTKDSYKWRIYVRNFRKSRAYRIKSLKKD